MQSKSLLIALAAFAVTTTGAQAYVGAKTLSRAGFSQEQIGALSTARDLRREGEVGAARDVLVAAGIDETALTSLREEVGTVRASVAAAVAANDFDTFRELVSESPLADLVTTEEDFAVFREAQALSRIGAHQAAADRYAELGADEWRGELTSTAPPESEPLSPEQADALQAARQANDRETVRAILAEAGFARDAAWR